MRVALVYPGMRADTKQMPLGIGYLASYIRSRHNDIEVTALDTGIATDREKEAFFDVDCDVVGISVTSRGYHEAVEVARTFKKKDPDTLVVFGGPHVSLLQSDVMEELLIDIAVYGEGELTFSELINALKKGRPTGKVLSAIKGLIYREDGRVRINAERELIKPLDSLPFPAFDLFPMERYPGKHPVITSRGCPFSCVFCAASKIWNRKWRGRSPENIIEEVKYVTKHFKARPIDFHDAIFNTSIKRINEVCDRFIEQKVRVPWGIRGFRADIIDVQTARKMHRAGCTHVAIGIESANPDMLVRIGKKETIEEIDRGINVLRAAGIDVLGQFMIGNPGETLETVRESIDYAKKSNLSQVGFGAAAPFPHTGLWRYVEENGKFLVDPDCTIFEDVFPRVIFETPEFSKEDRLEAIRLAQGAGFMDGGVRKRTLTRRLYDLALNLWFKRIYKSLPRPVAYHTYFLLRKIKAFVKKITTSVFARARKSVC